MLIKTMAIVPLDKHFISINGYKMHLVCYTMLVKWYDGHCFYKHLYYIVTIFYGMWKNNPYFDCRVHEY